MRPWEWGLVIGGSAAAAGLGYLAFRYLYPAPIQVETLTPAAPAESSSSSGQGPPVRYYVLSRPMTGLQVAKALGVSFSALVQANPGAKYMAKHPYGLLAAGQKLVIPQGSQAA
jgi:hypothetical protein